MMYNKNQEIHLKFPQSNIMHSFSYHMIIQPYAVPKSGNTLESKTSKVGFMLLAVSSRIERIKFIIFMN